MVHDQLRAPTAHDYRARWHLTPEAWGATETRGGAAWCAVTAPGLRLAVPEGFGAVWVEDGWVSPEYGVKHRAPVVVVGSDGAANADLITLIVPGEAPVRAAARIDEDRVHVTAGVGPARWELRWDVSRPGWGELEMGTW